jgi:hypothetical protein
MRITYAAVTALLLACTMPAAARAQGERHVSAEYEVMKTILPDLGVVAPR